MLKPALAQPSSRQSAGGRRLVVCLAATLCSAAWAAGETHHFFTELTALMVASAIIAFIGFRIGLTPIIGFLLAGVVIGPNALGFVQDRALIDAAAEVGVILLLFTIGIEFSLETLARLGRLIFVGGGLMVGGIIAGTTLLLLPFGVSWQASVFTGLLLSLSSTAIVMKLLADRSETTTEPGQASLGILIFQDLAVVAMVLVVPMLGGRAAGRFNCCGRLSRPSASSPSCCSARGGSCRSCSRPWRAPVRRKSFCSPLSPCALARLT